MPKITTAQLVRIMPNNPSAGDWTAALNDAMAEFGVAANLQRIAAFLAQVAHESGQLRTLEESLYYSTAKRLCQVWPKRFPTEAAAAPYARNPEGLANRVYALRIGNGDVASGDGWRYRGRGLKQLTGRANYKEAGSALGVDLVRSPDRLKEPVLAARSAAWFWQSRGCNPLADDTSGDDDDADFVAITKLINGGTIGLKERREAWARAETVLGI